MEVVMVMVVSYEENSLCVDVSPAQPRATASRYNTSPVVVQSTRPRAWDWGDGTWTGSQYGGYTVKRYQDQGWRDAKDHLATEIS